jgi:hypothetical protein
MKKQTDRGGFVMTGALMLLLIGILVAGSFMFVSRQSHPVVTQWARYDQTLLAAQTAMEKVKANLYDGFEDYYQLARSWDDLEWVVDYAASYSTSGVLSDILDNGATYAYSDAQVSVTVSSGSVVGTTTDTRVVYVTNTVSATYEGISRTIEEVVRYTLNHSSVFDHAYFINNYGWFYGVNCVVNGDLRSNYDMDLRSYDLVLNGYSYASGVNDINKPYQTWSWSSYKSSAYSSFFRPTYYVDQQATVSTGKGKKTTENTDAIFEYGFYSSDTFDDQDTLEMPYIGNLADYEEYAVENNGTIFSGSTLVVSNVYSGTGPSGVSGAADEGCVVLVGTAANPIVIDGPVVIEGDVIIKGYFTGQGTIYAGRNVHIIGDLTAVNAPQWEQPDTASNFEDSTLPDNLEADFMGLCAKGSIVIGDYRDSGFTSSIVPYLKPPFTDDYEVTATDSDIGYVSYTSDGVSYFDGDYSAVYGEKCSDSDASVGVDRTYYESSLSDTQFGSYSPDMYVDRLDAMIYNNHLTTGRFDSNAMINGGVICRDEALVPNGRIYMNWDCRLALKDRFNPFLPMELGPAETIQWREVE